MGVSASLPGLSGGFMGMVPGLGQQVSLPVNVTKDLNHGALRGFERRHHRGLPLLVVIEGDEVGNHQRQASFRG